MRCFDLGGETFLEVRIAEAVDGNSNDDITWCACDDWVRLKRRCCNFDFSHDGDGVMHGVSRMSSFSEESEEGPSDICMVCHSLSMFRCRVLLPSALHPPSYPLSYRYRTPRRTPHVP